MTRQVQTKLQLPDSTLFSAQQGAKIYRNAAVSHITSAQWTQIPFDTLDFAWGNDAGIYDLANNRLIARKTGPHLLTACIGFVLNATGSRSCVIRVNNVDKVGGIFAMAPSTAGGGVVIASGLAYLTAGDFVTGWGYQNSGAALAYLVGAMYCSLGMHLLQSDS